MAAINFDLNALCGNKWRFADTCRQYKDQGNCLQAIASFMNSSIKTVEGWIKTSETFPPEVRFPDIAPSVYHILVDLPNPIEAVKFARDEKFTVADAVKLRRKYVKHKRIGGRPFALVDEDLLVELYEKGFTDAEISEKLGVSRATIFRYREDLGLPPLRSIGKRGEGKSRKGQEAERLARVQKAADLKKQGLNTKEISQKLGVSQRNVQKYLQQAGVSDLTTYRDKVVEMYEEGKAVAEIAKELNCDQNTVRYHIRNSVGKPGNPMVAIAELTAMVERLEAENQALKKQCMTYLGQLSSINVRRFRRIS